MNDVKKKPQGEIRQSQLVTTFGPGSMVDLPNHSVLISGLDFWLPGGDSISEPRLSQKDLISLRFSLPFFCLSQLLGLHRSLL